MTIVAGRIRFARHLLCLLLVACSSPLALRADATLFRWAADTDAEGGPDVAAPLVTDRPDFTEASSTVGRGVWQLEMGYTFVEDRAGEVSNRQHSYPEALLRVGVFDDWLELRLAQNVASIQEDSETFGGAEDLYLGLKLGLTPQSGYLPEMALIPQMTLPTGDSALTTERVLGGVNWIYGWKVCDRISTAGSTQINRTLDETTGTISTAGAQSWTVAYQLTDRIGAYTEWFMIFPHGADTEKPQHYFNGGITLMTGLDLQWDVRAGLGLNNVADDFFVGTGFSYRFGPR